MLVAIVAAAFVGCSKDATSDVENVTSGNTVTVNFDASVEDETRATLTPNDGETAFAAAWEDGDQIGIRVFSQTLEEVTDDNVAGSWTANHFSAVLEDLGEETYVYNAYYPYSENGSIPFGGERTQFGSVYNGKYDIMISEQISATGAEVGKDENGNNIVFPMKRQTAIAYFHFTTSDANVESEKLASATLTVEGENSFIAAETVTPVYYGENRGTYTIEEGKGVKSIKITFDAATAPAAADFTAWFNVLPCTFESMTLELETENYTATILRNGAGEYVAGKLYKVSGELTKWVSKPVEVAPDGTILWSENWTGYSKDTQPSDATNVYNNEVVTYTYGKAGTKVYEENLAKGTAPELLLAKDGGLWNIHNIPTGNCKLATLSFKINKSSDTFCAISTDTNGVSISEVSITESYVHEYAITFSDGVKTFDLKFSNSSSSNSRLDDIELVVGKKIHKATSPIITVDSKDAGNGTFTASWTAIDGISQYAWRLTDKDDESQNVQNGTTGETSVTINNLDTAKQYVLYVKSVGDGVNYADSAEASKPISFGGTSGDEGGKGASYQYTFTAKQFSSNTTMTLDGLSWTIAGNGNFWGFDSTKGQQLGSSGAPYKALTVTLDYDAYCTGKGTSGGVEKIIINTSGASSINATFIVKVGGTQIGESTKLTTSATNYTFEVTDKNNLPTGDIIIEYTQTSSKAMYILSLIHI